MAEITQLLNRVDKYVKEAVAAFVSSMEEQRSAAADALRREMAGAESQVRPALSCFNSGVEWEKAVASHACFPVCVCVSRRRSWCTA